VAVLLSLLGSSKNADGAIDLPRLPVRGRHVA
jgi:hypothetical protein